MTLPCTTKDHGQLYITRETQQWTAEGCCKLLRQLDTRLTSLKRIIQGQEAAQDKRLRSEEPSSKRVRYTYGSNGVNKTRTNALKASSRTMRGVGRTVSEPPSITSQCEDAPELSDSCSSATHEFSGIKARSLDDLYESLRSLRNSIPAVRCRIYHANFEWLSSVLQATHHQPEDRHPRSLLSMCLRKLPDCVDDIVTWQQQNPSVADGPSTTRDVSLDLYKQLEKFGHQGIGWAPLKLAVRAQAISQLKKAVTEGLFPPHYVALLVKLCARLDCVPESACLASAMRVAWSSPRSPDDDFRMSRYLAPLQALLEETSGRSSGNRGKNHVFGTVSRLLQEKHLSSSWIPTKGFRAILRRALTAMARGDGGPKCLELVAAVLETLCSHTKDECCETQNDEPRIHVLIDIVSSLAALGLRGTGLETSETGETYPHTRQAHAAKSAVFVLDQCVNEYGQQDSVRQKGDLPSMILLLGRYLIGSGRRFIDRALMREQARSALNELVTDAQLQRLAAHYASLLICATSQKISSAQGISAKKMFVGLCQKLEKANLPARLLLDINNNTSHLPRVSELDACTISSPRAKISIASLQKPTNGNWRWEEGIGEWIPITAEMTGVGNLAKGLKRQADHDPNEHGQIIKLPHRVDERVHESVTRPRPPSPGSAGENVHANVGECLDMRGDDASANVNVTESEPDWAGRGQARVGKPNAVAGPESLAASHRLEVSRPEVREKPAQEGKPPRIGFHGRGNQVHGKECQVRVGKDLITEPPSPHIKSMQAKAGCPTRPAAGRRPRTWGRLLILSDGRHDGRAGQKRSRPPAKSHDLETDWDDVR